MAFVTGAVASAFNSDVLWHVWGVRAALAEDWGVQAFSAPEYGQPDVALDLDV